jgi:hypothetical protein
MFRETGALLGALGAARPEAPLPDDLARRVEQTLADARNADTVVPLRRPSPAWRPAALAASVALIVGAVGGIVASLSLRAPEGAAPSLALLDAPGIGDALDSLPAGSRGLAGDGEVEIISSFLTDDGAFCREFEFDRAAGGRIVSVACRDDAAWTARFAMVTQGADDDGLRAGLRARHARRVSLHDRRGSAPVGRGGSRAAVSRRLIPAGLTRPHKPAEPE